MCARACARACVVGACRVRACARARVRKGVCWCLCVCVYGAGARQAFVRVRLRVALGTAEQCVWRPQRWRAAAAAERQCAATTGMRQSHPLDGELVDVCIVDEEEARLLAGLEEVLRTVVHLRGSGGLVGCKAVGTWSMFLFRLDD